MASGDNQQYDPSPYLAVLDEFEREGHRRARQARITFSVIFGGGLLAAVILQLAGVFVLAWQFYAVFLTMSLAVLWLNWHLRQNSLWRYYERQLPGSGLAGRLAQGEFHCDPIHDYLAWPESWLDRRVARGDYTGQLWRIANCIEWYVKPPAIYNPISTFVISAALGCFAIGLFLIWVARGAEPLPNSLAAIALLTGAGMLALPRYQGVEYVQPLADYLRASWTDAGATAEQVMRSAANGLAIGPLVNRLTVDLQRAAVTRGCLPLILMCIVLVSLLSILFSAVAAVFNCEPPAWLIAVIMLVLILLLAMIERNYLRAVETNSAGKLLKIDLATRLVSGKINSAEIVAHVPRLFRFCVRRPGMPRGYDDEFSKSAWRVAFNLDWFLAEPRPLLRARWVAWLVFWVLLVAVVALVVPFDLPLIYPLGFWLVLAALAAAAVLDYLDYLRAGAWIRAFCHHLRERLVDDAVAPNQS